MTLGQVWYLIVLIPDMTFQPDPEVKVCVRSKFLLLCWSIFFPFNLICNITTFRIFFLPFDQTQLIKGVCNVACGALPSIPFNLICNAAT